MKYLLGILLLFSLTIQAQTKNDTIPYWSIGYGKLVVIEANLRAMPKQKHTLTVKPDALEDLSISFVYASGQPGKSTLTVKERSEILRTFDQHPEMGPVFLVPVRELIGTHQNNVQYELDFFYTDDRGQKNLKLGTIIFNMQ